MGITMDQLQGMDGHGKVVTTGGDKVGGIGQIYVDDATGAPNWVTVKTGLFGTAETFIPVEAARLDGHDVVVNYSEDTIKAAPRVDADGHLSPQEEDALYRHYGLTGFTDDTTAGHAGQGVDGDRDRDDRDRADRDRADRDRAGLGADEAMTRSEEQLRVGTKNVEAGRARMRKFVVTEQVTKTVPVSHEEAHLVREPITDTNRDAATTGLSIGAEEHEVVLHEEVPVVEKDVVAVERVRMDTTTVTEQETVSAEVRKEQIEVDDPTTKSGKSKGPKSSR